MRERERERDIEFGMRGWGERRKLLQPCEELKSDERERERERDERMRKEKEAIKLPTNITGNGKEMRREFCFGNGGSRGRKRVKQ